jgi:hypothetical protein
MPPTIPHELASARVLSRFLLRILILAVCATFGRQGFGKTIEQLLILAVCYCVAIGGFRREAPLGPVLTHYDEAAAYGMAAILAAVAG